MAVLIQIWRKSHLNLVQSVLIAFEKSLSEKRFSTSHPIPACLNLPLQLYLYLWAFPTSLSQIFHKKLVGSLLKGGEYESGNSYKNMKYSHSTAALLWESFQGYFCPNGQFNLSTWANFTDWHTYYTRTKQTNQNVLTACFKNILAGQKLKTFRQW